MLIHDKNIFDIKYHSFLGNLIFLSQYLSIAIQNAYPYEEIYGLLYLIYLYLQKRDNNTYLCDKRDKQLNLLKFVNCFEILQ